MRKFVEENGQKTIKKTNGLECHLTFTKETPYESKYLIHRVLPNIGATGAVHAEQVVDVLHEFNCENTIKAILVDNTNAKIFFVCYIFTYNRKKLIVKVFKYYCLIHNVKKQFIETDTENEGDFQFED